MRIDTTVIIPCHDPQRPIRRAVCSALKSAGTRVLVIAHNTDTAAMKRAVGTVDGLSSIGSEASRVEVIGFSDGVNSPAGPFNYGLDIAKTIFVARLDSDDVLETGAVDSWRKLALRWKADMVLTRLHRGQSQAPIHAPAVRPWLYGVADPVQDRLFYRNAPLGLIRLSRVRELQLHMTEELSVGEDIAFSTQLYASSRVVVQRRGPGYLVGEDADNRVTEIPRPIDKQLQHITDLLNRNFISGLEATTRESIAIKTLRILIFGVLDTREKSWWSPRSREALAEYAQAVMDFAPGCEQVFSRADTALLDAILNPSISVDIMYSRAQARRKFFTPQALIPAYPKGWWHREGPLRFDVASFLVR